MRKIKEGDVVHCPTKEEAVQLLKLASKQGYTWCGGSNLTADAKWENYESKTCYTFESTGTVYSSVDYELKEGVEFEEARHFLGKEIIGYKLVKDEYKEAAIKIIGVKSLGELSNGVHFNSESMAKDKLTKAGVIDLWFEPVYKAEKPTLPVLFGYVPLFDGNIISYGCKTFSVRSIKEMLDNSVTNIEVESSGRTYGIEWKALKQIKTYIEWKLEN